MDQLDDDCLISIFKRLDLKTRLIASQTCKKWFRYMIDFRTRMDDVAVVLNYKSNRQNNGMNDIRHLTPLLAHIGFNSKSDSVLLEIRDRNLNTISNASEILHDIKFNFMKKVAFLGSQTPNAVSVFTCLAMLPPSVKDVEIYQSSIGPSYDLLRIWPQPLRLESLKLIDINIHASTILPPSLKNLEYGWQKRENFLESLDWLLDHLSDCPLLEKLEIGCDRSTLIFDDVRFKILLHSVNDHLTNLNIIKFIGVDFVLFTIDFAQQSTVFRNLETIEFFECTKSWQQAGEEFISASTSLYKVVIGLDFKALENSSMYQLITGINKKGAKFELNLNGHGFDECPMPLELYTTLTKLTFLEAKFPRSIKSILNGGFFVTLTHLEFNRCQGLNDTILKIIAQVCLHLKSFIIFYEKNTNYEITQNGFQPFLQYWQSRKSNQLSISVENAISIDGLFGTDIVRETGALDETKRWLNVRKVGLRCGTVYRLMIWDQNLGLNSKERKMLVIKNYGEYSLNRVDFLCFDI